MIYMAAVLTVGVIAAFWSTSKRSKAHGPWLIVATVFLAAFAAMSISPQSLDSQNPNNELILEALERIVEAQQTQEVRPPSSFHPLLAAVLIISLSSLAFVVYLLIRARDGLDGKEKKRASLAAVILTILGMVFVTAGQGFGAAKEALAMWEAWRRVNDGGPMSTVMLLSPRSGVPRLPVEDPMELAVLFEQEGTCTDRGELSVGVPEGENFLRALGEELGRCSAQIGSLEVELKGFSSSSRPRGIQNCKNPSGLPFDDGNSLNMAFADARSKVVEAELEKACGEHCNFVIPTRSFEDMERERRYIDQRFGRYSTRRGMLNRRVEIFIEKAHLCDFPVVQSIAFGEGMGGILSLNQ